MKQLVLTEELKALIKARVGEDVDLEGIAVFEAITLNTKPLPGKKGTIWEGAVASPLTLRQIADHINAGGHIPLISDHELLGSPKGRVFKAGVDYSGDGEFELRTLFYLDQTEASLVTKLNAGSLDEVSISFLPTSYLCSECGWDYLGEGATFENFMERTCGNGHVIGEDGVHVRMVGLNQLIEVSLVARGAADNPKIVGRSASKLAPATAQALAARGFETDRLVCQASRGEINTMNTEKLTADLIDAKTQLGILEAAAERHTTELTAANERATGFETQLTAANERITALEAELETANGESHADEAEAAVTYLTSVLEKLHVAAGETAKNLPTTVAELTAAIDEKTKGLTALIPAGGKSKTGTELSDEDQPERTFGAFKTPTRR